jgi:invasion protein IalB
MNSRFSSSIAALAVLSLLLLPHIASPVLAQQAAQPGATAGDKPTMAPLGERKIVREVKYGDWQKFCFDTPGSKTVCRTSISGTWDTGQSAVRADLIEREGEANAAATLPARWPVPARRRQGDGGSGQAVPASLYLVHDEYLHRRQCRRPAINPRYGGGREAHA